MTMINMIEPKEWPTYLAAFTARNRKRRARFEIFGPRGGIREEAQEGRFESISIDGHTVIVKRQYQNKGQNLVMTDELKNIRGIAVQYDTDKSEDMLEFTDERDTMTVLRFRSRVDGNA